MLSFYYPLIIRSWQNTASTPNDTRMAPLTGVSMKVFHSQRAYIKEHPQYREAYEIGVTYFRRRWGDRLLWQTIALARGGDWAQAFKFLLVLLRFYPQGVLQVLHHKLSRVMLGNHG